MPVKIQEGRKDLSGTPFHLGAGCIDARPVSNPRRLIGKHPNRYILTICDRVSIYYLPCDRVEVNLMDLRSLFCDLSLEAQTSNLL